MLEDDPDRAGDDTLADAGDDAARHQHVLHDCRIGMANYPELSHLISYLYGGTADNVNLFILKKVMQTR